MGWNNLVLGMIGATIEPANMITGIRLVDKLSGPRAANVIRLEIWFTNFDDTGAVQQLRRNVEKCMATRLDALRAPRRSARRRRTSSRAASTESLDKGWCRSRRAARALRLVWRNQCTARSS